MVLMEKNLDDFDVDDVFDAVDTADTVDNAAVCDSDADFAAVAAGDVASVAGSAAAVAAVAMWKNLRAPFACLCQGGPYCRPYCYYYHLCYGSYHLHQQRFVED